MVRSMAVILTLLLAATAVLAKPSTQVVRDDAWDVVFEIPAGAAFRKGQEGVTVTHPNFQKCSIQVRIGVSSRDWNAGLAKAWLERALQKKAGMEQDVNRGEVPLADSAIGPARAWAMGWSYTFLERRTLAYLVGGSYRRASGVVHRVVLEVSAPVEAWAKWSRAVSLLQSTFEFQDPKAPEPVAATEPEPSTEPDRPGPRTFASSQNPSTGSWDSSLPSGGGGKAGAPRKTGARGGPGKASGVSGQQFTKGPESKRDIWKRILKQASDGYKGPEWKNTGGYRKREHDYAMSGGDAAVYGAGAGVSDSSTRTDEQQDRAIGFFNPSMSKEK